MLFLLWLLDPFVIRPLTVAVVPTYPGEIVNDSQGASYPLRHAFRAYEVKGTSPTAVGQFYSEVLKRGPWVMVTEEWYTDLYGFESYCAVFQRTFVLPFYYVDYSLDIVPILNAEKQPTGDTRVYIRNWVADVPCAEP